MTDQSANAGEWPNRGHELVISACTMATLATLVAGWRLAVRFRMSPWMGLSDWLMLGGVVLNAVGCAYAVVAAKQGQGRLMADPYWFVPGHTSNQLHLIFITQTLNVYAMFLVKLSICAYLMALDFSRSYRILIWFSVVVVVLCNFVMMLVLHFAYCRPYWSRWDMTVKGSCWPLAVSEASGYVQIASNILTDLIYAAAPIVYLRNVQLSKQTQWGVRIVFLMALVGTGISIAKIPITAKFLKSQEGMYDAIGLSTCSINEVCVGIVIANLPPLRKILIGTISKAMPSGFFTTMGGSSRKRQSQYHANSTGYTSKGHTKIDSSADDESERYILELEDRKTPGITKTTHVSIRNEEDGPSH